MSGNRPRTSRALALVAVLAVIAAPAAAEDDGLTPEIPFSFDAHRFSLRLPVGFKLLDEGSRFAGYKYFGFASAPDDQGFSGVVQVGLFDLEVAGPTTLKEFTRTQMETWKRSHKDWAAGSESSVEASGVPAIRVRWTATFAFPDGRSLPVQGTSIMGIKGRLAFRLEAFDSTLRAPMLPLREKSLASFRVTQ